MRRLLLLLFCIGPSLGYVWVRNKQFDDDEKVLTPRHLRELARKYLKINLGGDEVKGRREKGIPLRFLPKSSGRSNEDAGSVGRVQGSVGYRAALEMVAREVLPEFRS